MEGEDGVCQRVGGLTMANMFALPSQKLALALERIEEGEEEEDDIVGEGSAREA